MKERRRYPRVTLRKPIRASVGATPVFVLDASRGGLRVAHHAQLPQPGSVCRIDVPSDVGPIRLDCAIVHTAIQHATSAAKNLFYSGLQIVDSDRQSAERMKAIVASGEPLDD